MAFSKQFEKELDRLFRQQTHWLRSKLGLTKQGKPPRFGGKKVKAGINKLQKLASNAFSQKLAKDEFEKHAKTRKLWHIKGHGVIDKKKQFNEWYNQTFGSRKGYVYAFWRNNSECIYVGRTRGGVSRLLLHFEKFWFSQVNQITLFPVRSKSQIPKLECLAIHRFQPKHNKNKAATKKWRKDCPLCAIHRLIEQELRHIFWLK